MLSSLIKKIAGRAVKLVVAVVILGAGFALYNLLVETRAVVEPQPRQEVVNRVRIIPVVLQDARPIYVSYQCGPVRFWIVVVREPSLLPLQVDIPGREAYLPLQAWMPLRLDHPSDPTHICCGRNPP